MDLDRLEKLLSDIDEHTLTPEQDEAYWDAQVELLRAERESRKEREKA